MSTAAVVPLARYGLHGSAEEAVGVGVAAPVHHRPGDVVAGVLEQMAGRSTVCVAHDLATDGVGGVVVDAEFGEGRRVAPHAVQVARVEVDGTVGDDGVEHVPGGFAAGYGRERPTHAEHTRGVWAGGRPCEQLGLDLLEGGAGP